MKNLLLFLALLYSTASFSQVDVNRFKNIVGTANGQGSPSGAGFKGRYSTDGVLKGDPYLDSTFAKSRIVFYKDNQEIVTPSRYVLFSNELEVKTTGGVRAVDASLVKSYHVVRDRDTLHYVNAAEYTIDGTKLVGMIQRLSSGKLELLKYTKMDIIKPTYNPSLETGDRNTYLKKNESLYVSRNNQLEKVKNKKQLAKLLGITDGGSELARVFDKADFKDENDLRAVFNLYNKQ